MGALFAPRLSAHWWWREVLGAVERRTAVGPSFMQFITAEATRSSTSQPPLPQRKTLPEPDMQQAVKATMSLGEGHMTTTNRRTSRPERALGGRSRHECRGISQAAQAAQTGPREVQNAAHIEIVPCVYYM